MNARIVSKVVVLNDQGKILILRRSKTDPRRPGTWDLPGGRVEQDEDPGAAAAREATEEAGIVIDNLRPVYITSEQLEYFVITTVFAADYKSGDIVLSFEHDDFKWIDPAEFEQIEIPPKYKKAVRNLN